MSAYKRTKIKICTAHEDCLIGALMDIGFPRQVIEVHKKARALHGYEGDARPEKAHIIIRQQSVGSASNDLGFERVGDSYVLHVSEYDQGVDPAGSKIGMAYGDQFIKSLLVHYAGRVVRKTMTKKGYRLQSTQTIGTKSRMVWTK